MKIRQIRFDGSGALSGRYEIDPGRLAVLVVDTDRERSELAADLERVLIEAVAGRVPAVEEAAVEVVVEMETPAGVAMLPVQTSGSAGLWRVAREFKGKSAESVPWFMQGQTLAGQTDLRRLATWLKQWADTRGGGRTAEDVARELTRARRSYKGLQGRVQDVDLELGYIEQELNLIRAQTGSLDEERRCAVQSLDGLSRTNKLRNKLEPAVRELERWERRARHAELSRRVESHRSAHKSLKQVRRELAQLDDVRNYPSAEEIHSVVKTMKEWAATDAALGNLEEELADTSRALERCQASLKARSWAAPVVPELCQKIDDVALRLEKVAVRLKVQISICEREAQRSPECAALVSQFLELDSRLREIVPDDRDFVRASLPQVLGSLYKLVATGANRRYLTQLLDKIRTLENRVHGLSALIGLCGLAIAFGVPVSRWHHPELADGALYIGGGVLLLFLAVGAWSSAGGIIAGKRVALEGQLAATAMPLEVEGLRLVVMELRMEELCRRFGQSRGEDLVADVSKYEELCSVKGTDVIRTARQEMDEIRTTELAPLETEARTLLSIIPVPMDGGENLPAPIRALATPQTPGGMFPCLSRVGWMARELKTFGLGKGVADRLANTLRHQTESRDALAAKQAERLAKVKELLQMAGVQADPTSECDQIVADLLTRQKRHERWVQLKHTEEPRYHGALLAADQYRAAVRELRQLEKKMTPAELAREPVPFDARRSQRLNEGRMHLLELSANHDRLKKEAQRRVVVYHRRLSQLMERRSRLLHARARAVTFREAVHLSLKELTTACAQSRGTWSQALNTLAVPQLVEFHPRLKGLKVKPDLSFVLPSGLDVGPLMASLFAVAARAALASRSGPAGEASPLVIVEPLDACAPKDACPFLTFLANALCPRQQIILITRRRSLFDGLRWEYPALFKRMQIAESGS